MLIGEFPDIYMEESHWKLKERAGRFENEVKDTFSMRGVEP
jgi:hypothetical protein